MASLRRFYFKFCFTSHLLALTICRSPIDLFFPHRGASTPTMDTVDPDLLQKFLALPARRNLTMLPKKTSAFFWTVRPPPVDNAPPPPPYLFLAVNTGSQYAIAGVVTSKSARDVFLGCLTKFIENHLGMRPPNPPIPYRPAEIWTCDPVCQRVLQEVLGDSTKVILVKYKLHKLQQQDPAVYGDGEIYYACGNDSCGMFLRSELKVCSGCKVMYFCSRACHEVAWKAHKQECSMLKDLTIRPLDESGDL